MSTLPSLRYKRGTTVALSILWVVNDAPVDLTGYTVTCWARDRQDTTEGTPLAVADVTLGDQTLAPGSLLAVFDADVTETWPPGVRVDARAVSPSGYVSQSQTLALEMVPRVTA